MIACQLAATSATIANSLASVVMRLCRMLPPALLMLLAERGIELDAPFAPLVEHHFPHIAASFRDVSVRQLLDPERNVTVPRPVAELSARTVLTMQYFEGRPLRDLCDPRRKAVFLPQFAQFLVGLAEGFLRQVLDFVGSAHDREDGSVHQAAVAFDELAEGAVVAG